MTQAILPVAVKLPFNPRHVVFGNRDFVARLGLENEAAPYIAPVAGDRAVNDVAVARLLPVRRLRRCRWNRWHRVAEQELNGVIDRAGMHLASQIRCVRQIQKLLERHFGRRRDATSADEGGDGVAKKHVIAKKSTGVAEEEEKWVTLMNRGMGSHGAAQRVDRTEPRHLALQDRRAHHGK